MRRSVAAALFGPTFHVLQAGAPDAAAQGDLRPALAEVMQRHAAFRAR